MNFIEQLERFKKLDKLIKQEKTGCPIELANRLKIGRSHLYHLLDTLKDYGADINYSRKKQSFYYQKPFNFNVLFINNNVISDTEMKKIKGGFSKNITPSFFIRRNKSTFTPSFAQNKDISYKCL